MRTAVSLAMVFLLALADNHQGPRCYDGCYIFTEFAKAEGFGDPVSIMDQIDEKFKKCGTDTIKYCEKDETCNHFSGKAQLGAQFETSETAATDGLAKMKHFYCGASTDTINDDAPRCNAKTDSVKATMISLSSTDNPMKAGDFKVHNLDELSLACMEHENCGADCVDMNEHPDWEEDKEERHEPSAATATNMSLLLLSALLFIFAM